MNESLLRQVQAQILDEPRRFDMDQWFNTNDCNTAACICGWSAAIHYGVDSLEAVCAKTGIDARPVIAGWSQIDYHGGLKLMARVTEILGISGEQAQRLFFDDRWPTPFKRAWMEYFSNMAARAEVASARIDYFIATNGTDVETPTPAPATNAEPMTTPAPESLHV